MIGLKLAGEFGFSLVLNLIPLPVRGVVPSGTIPGVIYGPSRSAKDLFFEPSFFGAGIAL